MPIGEDSYREVPDDSQEVPDARQKVPDDSQEAADGGPPAGSVPVSLIRQGLEVAWLVGRAGLAANPPIEPPRRLRPLLRFSKLPAKSLVAVRDIVESDEEFRCRVAAALDVGSADPASRLWLVRPDGWKRELAALIEEADAAAYLTSEGRAERQARRRLVAVEAARARSDQDAEAARRAATERLAELNGERRARRLAEEEAAELRAEIDGARLAAANAVRSATQFGRLAEAAEAAAAELRSNLKVVGAERDRLAGEAAHLGRALAVAEESGRIVAAGAEHQQTQVGAAVLEAARAAQGLGVALDRAGRALGGSDAPPDSALPGGGVVADAGAGPLGDAFSARNGRSLQAAQGGAPGRSAGPPGPPSARRRRDSSERRAIRERRRPVPVPGGLFEDSVEVAARLVRRPNAVLLVDGYNVSLNTWPGVGLAEQRQRLTFALGELAARSGASIHIVFDASAEELLPPPLGEPRRPVRVSFSASGADADEVLIDLVEQCHPSRPVVVATDDRRVRAEVDLRGANTISVAQLLGVLGRRPQNR